MSGDAVVSTGARLYIGGNVPCTTKAQYEALTWVEVEEVTELGDFGPDHETVTYKPLSGGVRTRKGSRKNGTPQLKLARIPTAAGQAAIKTAVDDTSNKPYNFMITLDDADSGDPTTFYFPAFVMSYTTNIGSSDKVVESSVTLAIDGNIIEVAAA